MLIKEKSFEFLRIELLRNLPLVDIGQFLDWLAEVTRMHKQRLTIEVCVIRKKIVKQ